MVKNLPANTVRDKRHGFNPWVGKIPWRRAQQPTPVFLPGKSHNRGAWQAIVHRVAQSDMTEVTYMHTHRHYQTVFNHSCLSRKIEKESGAREPIERLLQIFIL